MKKHKRTILILSVMFITVVLDQITKIISRQTMPGQERLRYLNDFVVFEYSENTGAFLSLGAQMPENVRFAVFSVLVALVLGWFTWSLFKDKKLPKDQTIAMSLIIGGGIGNLIDRIGRGSVTDFVHMGFGSLRTGIFNVADIAVTAGAIIMLLFPLIKKMKKESVSASAEQ